MVSLAQGNERKFEFHKGSQSQKRAEKSASEPEKEAPAPEEESEK